MRPRALLLDEPFAALDPALRSRMRRELDALQQRLAIPMIVITHDPEDVHALGGHVLRMEQGRIAEVRDVIVMERNGA
jgi:molybdate transport system ATP-binding protein